MSENECSACVQELVPPFVKFPSIPRLTRWMIVSEKIDGTNASIYIPEDGGPMRVGSRTRWITPESDNFGFARFAYEHEQAIREKLGYGHHFGEWWGPGIQRGYGIPEKRFSLFNTHRWTPAIGHLPPQIDVVPVLYEGEFNTEAVDIALANLRANGSSAAPGFLNPEGVVVFHVKGNHLFKKTLDKNDGHKGES